MPEPRFFRKILVANRGEIARRVFRTLHEMGIASVAVFSDADRDAAFVAEADEAVRLGPAPSVESYLDQAAVIAAAKAVGADAVHPGYGFLAENASFAERCVEAGLVFIGPSPEAIRRMGDKAVARTLAVELGIPVVDGFSVSEDGDAVERQAGELGYPLLIKAAAGGGGKGMRVVSQPSGLASALAAASREAAGAFGDPSLLIERYVDAPRHVEIQILGDAHGVIHLFERDCSVQRRHQKVFEEAPSPAVDAALRQRLGEAAVALARAVEYRGAGTVEFLLTADGSFFFLEMNTRLQVEHPVTEAVTGLDLVRSQIEIAQGLPLTVEQEALELRGHAIEARLYAEDPVNDFLPAAGTVALWALPAWPGLRIDSGVEEGEVVGVHYDPMLAKVIVHARTREEAVEQLHRGLSRLAVGGLKTNRDFLLAVLEHDAFRRGEVDTAFIDRHLPPAARSRPVDPAVLELHAIAATLFLFAARRQEPSPVPSGVAPGWRNNRWRPQEQVFEHAGGRVAVRYGAAGDRFAVDVVLGDEAGESRSEKRALAVRLVKIEDGALVAEVEGVRRRYLIGWHLLSASLSASHNRVAPISSSFTRVAPTRVAPVASYNRVAPISSSFTPFTRVAPIRVAPFSSSFTRVAPAVWTRRFHSHGLSVYGLSQVSELTLVPRFPERATATVAGGCVAPMTGKVVDVLVSEGDRVEAGATLVILEAMKMEHRLQAATDGVVKTVRVTAGQMVDPDDVLVVITALGPDEP